MTLKELSHLFKNAVSEGAEKALNQSGGLPGTYTKAEAYRLYGRSDVDRWLAERLIIPAIKNGTVSKIHLDRIKLERVAASSNRITYLPVAER
jgi:hypothetical protein